MRLPALSAVCRSCCCCHSCPSRRSRSRGGALVVAVVCGLLWRVVFLWSLLLPLQLLLLLLFSIWQFDIGALCVCVCMCVFLPFFLWQQTAVCLRNRYICVSCFPLSACLWTYSYIHVSVAACKCERATLCVPFGCAL